MHQTATYFLSNLKVEVRTSAMGVIEAIDAMWGRCKKAWVEISRRVTYVVEHGSELVVRVDGEEIGRPWEPRGIPPLLERHAYRALIEEHPKDIVVLHAACVTRGEQPWVLLGPSGAGKSTLALTALQRGYGYYSDEFTCTDGARVWGVPRSLQFRPLAESEPLIPRLRGLDLAACPGLGSYGEQYRTPCFAPSEGQVPASVADASVLRALCISPGAHTSLEPLEPLRALKLLHESAFRTPHRALGELVGSGRAWRLTWDDPEHGLDVIDRLT